MGDKSELLIDYGNKLDQVKNSTGRCVQDFINKRGIPSFLPNTETDKNNSPIVILRSNTVDTDRLCERKVRTYPSIDLLSLISNKMKFKRSISNIGVLGPSTNLLPSRYLKLHHDFVDRISDEWLIKPNVTIGKHRGVAPQVLFYPFSEKAQLFSTTEEFGIDFVRQRFIRGKLKKVFSIRGTNEFPDGFSFEHGYETNQHLSMNIIDKSQIETEVCHPIILAKMQYLLAKFGLLWSGVDYVESDNGYIYVIDMNPTNGGRKSPKGYESLTENLLAANVDSLQVRYPEVSPQESPSHRLIIMAAGENKRLAETIGCQAKSLLTFNGETILNRVIQTFNGIDFNERTLIYPKIYEDSFLNLVPELNANGVSLRVAEVAKNHKHTPANDSFFTVRPNEILTLVAADRIIKTKNLKLLHELMKQNFDQIKQDDELVFSFFVVQQQNSNSKYAYFIDKDGIIKDIVGPDDVGISLNGGRYEKNLTRVNIKKLALMIHGSKIPFLEADSLDDVVRKIIRVGLKGKLVLIPEVDWIGDLDTAKDYSEFISVLGK